MTCTPREAGQRAAAGEISAALLPVADYLRLESSFERVGRFGIGVRGRAHSVLLFTKKPIRQLDGAVIAVTEETSTTALLLRLILEQRYELKPKAYRRGEAGDADALLLIGDEALRFQAVNNQYPFEIDLAFEWWLWQHLPFVFAVWAVRSDAPADEKKWLETQLSRSLGVAQHQRGEIAKSYSAALGVNWEQLEAYLAGFIYRLGPLEEEGIALFRKLVNEHHLL